MQPQLPPNTPIEGAYPVPGGPKPRFGVLKHPLWATVGAVVAIGGLAVAYFQMSGGAKPAALEVANVSFQITASIDARAGGSDMDEADWESTTAPASPIDISLKNNGGTRAHIVRIETKVLDAKTVTCNRQGGGSVVSAYYGVKVPYNPWTMELSSDTVSTAVDYTVKAGSVDRMVVTVGPEETGNGKAIVLAVQLSLVPEQGEPIVLEPLALTQPDSVDNEIQSNAMFDTKHSDPHCAQEQASVLDHIIQATKMQSRDVIRLRDDFQGQTT
jgi:hypothetical protein